MTNRYHLPVVITTSDDFSRTDAIDYVERVLANLEETDSVYRTYVEESGIEDGEAARLLDMLSMLDQDSFDDAIEAIDRISTEGNE